MKKTYRVKIAYEGAVHFDIEARNEIEAHVREYHYCDAEEFKASILRLLKQLTTEDRLLKFNNITITLNARME